MKCIQCGGECVHGVIKVGPDDFVCSEKCNDAFTEANIDFIKNIVGNPDKFREWMKNKKVK